LAYERGELIARSRVRTRTARQSRVTPPPAYTPDRVRAVRAKLGVSQPVFAAAMAVSTGTVAAWEQGRRVPDGSARRLLEVAEAHPEALLEKVEPRDVKP
jgi:putative transcriptional regulator